MLQEDRKTLNKSKQIFAFLEIPPAIRSPNLSCFVIGESLSFFGSWMTQIALVWMVYQLTNSAMLVGIAGFTNQAMGLIITPLVGVMLDRWNLRYVLLTTQVVSIVLSSLLTFLTVNDYINVTYIIIIGILQGIVKAFDLPARQVIIPRLVENKSDTYSAIAVHSFLINTAKFVSPMIGGFIIARNGAASCFLVDAISYLPFISAMLTVQIKPTINNLSTSKSAKIWHNLKEGFIFAHNFTPIKYILILQIIVCFMAMTYVNLIPVFTKEVLKGNAETMGFLMTASAFGSIFSGIYLVARNRVIGIEKVMAISTLVLGVSLILFSRSTQMEICLLLIFIVGLTNTLTLASINNFMQVIIVEEDKRGRVTSIFMTTFLGILPFGNLFFGGLASIFGVDNALLFGGICCLIGAYFFARQISNIRKVVNPIYQAMGLIS
ncbi:MFS transporter [Trichormus variabilis]|uniref:MFS transporter n=1 Tax=Trichormus variabilis SAG 1403-4b TaxID=447716 RepID=A0A3S1A4L6_ANAVA|nr:MFS transporter [Trichormus variabilis]MBD2629419.1 MFS transporter [Trichormus variabilis FACHB-164]RUS93579.1 MFS transporter [Trichormus variabilis SAG 1403-4b]